MISRLQAWIVAVAAALALAVLGLVADALVRFAEPRFLLLLVVPAAMVAAFVSYLVWRGNTAARLGRLETVRGMTSSWSGRAATARATLAVLGITMLVLAAARPQWGEQTREVSREGIDVVFALDISRSMLAGDVPPSRLDAAVAEMDRLMRLLEGDRVGLVVFAGIAFVQSPLTSDYGAIRLYLDRLSPDALPAQGTAIGRALTEATRLLTGGVGGEDFERAESQLIILFTDGEDHETNPVAAAEAARAAGIDVFTVGVGTPDGARIPLRGPDGTIRDYLRDRNDQVVVTRLVEDQLGRIAEAGGGEYVRFSTEGAAAAVLEAAIEEYDAAALSSALRQQYEDRFLFFLVPGFLLLLLATVIPERRRSGGLVAGLVALLALGVSGCADGLTREDPHVERAMQQLDAGEPEVALETLARVPGEAEDMPELHYDRGLIHEALEAWRDAQDSYLRALNVDDPAGRVSALVALGNALLAQENYETAIERYRRALVLDPTHETARRNLEIALLRLYPPCSALDDEAEDNDSFEAAGTLSPAVYQGEYLPPGVEVTGSEEAPGLVLCGGDSDWWAIPVVGGATLDVTVELHRLRDDTGHDPLPATIPPTSVRIALVDVDGETPLAVDQGLADAEGGARVDATRLTRSLAGVAISPTVDADGIAFLEVEADGDLEYEYEIAVTLTPPCWALEDGYESNDSPEQATELTESGDYDARLCVSNDDWYARDVSPGEHLFVDILPPVRDDDTAGVAEVRFEAAPGDRAARVDTLRDGVGTSFEVRDPAEPTRATIGVTSVDDTEGRYRVSSYHYPPCPEGNDRYEPNDVYQRAHQVDAQQDPPPFRHLRLCEADQDWFQVPLPEVPEEEREDQPLRPFSALVEIDGDPAEVHVVVYDSGTGTAVAASTPVAVAPPESFVGDAPPTGFVAYARLPWETQAVTVLVTGAPTFYDLSFPHTVEQPPPDQPQGSEGEPSEDQQQDPQQDSEQEQAEEQDQGDEQQEEQQSDTGTEEAEQTSQPEPTDEEEARELLLQLLDSLESEDVNLPLQQALEAAPSQSMRDEW